MRTRPWKLLPLLLCHLLAILAISSLFHPITAFFWEKIDITTFKTLNETLRDQPRLQMFWACANHKLADWIEDLFILGFFLLYIKQLPRGSRYRGVARFIFSILLVSSVIYVVNRKTLRHSDISRPSPTYVVEHCVRLSEEIPNMKIKDATLKSFPGDHATTALFFAALFTCFAPFRLSFFAIIYACFLCLPRVVVGAHWLTDILIGSGSIVAVILGWTFFTPFGMWAIAHLENGCLFLTRKKQLAD